MDNEVYTLDDSDQSTDLTGLKFHSGFPNPREGVNKLSLDFNRLLVKSPASTFVFKVQGQDLGRYSICHDDLVVVDRLINPKPLDMLVWHNENQPGFNIDSYNVIPKQAVIWGVITAIVRKIR